VFCDLLEKKKGPVLGFIPLPTTAFDLRREGQAQRVRDVACCNGFISFVEIEHCLRERNIVNCSSFKMTQNLDTEDVILDKAFLTRDDLDRKPELVPDGWKIRTMFKGISWDYWKTRHTVYADDIAAVPQQSVPLPRTSLAPLPRFDPPGCVCRIARSLFFARAGSSHSARARARTFCYFAKKKKGPGQIDRATCMQMQPARFQNRPARVRTIDRRN
jgi:hypothetical protein